MFLSSQIILIEDYPDILTTTSIFNFYYFTPILSPDGKIVDKDNFYNCTFSFPFLQIVR